MHKAKYLICLMALLSLSMIVKAQDSWSLEQLMQQMSEVDSFKANFEEVKDFAFFTDAITVSGFLIYKKPGYLKRQVLVPHKEMTIIEDDIIHIERQRTGENDQTQEQQISVDIHPAVRTLIESIRATFAGDISVLQKYYELALTGTQADWQLQLHPLQEKVKEHVQQVKIFGSGREVNKIITTETDDSESEITIDKIVFS